MSRFILYLCICLQFIFFSGLLHSALKRNDLHHNLDDEAYTINYCISHWTDQFCDHSGNGYRCFINDPEIYRYLHLIPSSNILCHECDNNAIYRGYYDLFICRYNSHLKSHLQYCIENPYCKCYWPESAGLAEEINNLACDLFKDLLSYEPINKINENGFVYYINKSY